MALNRDALETFALNLVRTPSPSGQEGAVAELVRPEMERLGYAVEVDALGNVVGTLDFGPGPCVLFDAHMDTVGVTDPAAWSVEPFGELRDGRLYGRGSMDMKGPLAAVIHGAAAAAAGGGRVVVSASIAEEMIEGYATVDVARRVRPDVAVICEASARRVAVGQRGRAELVVEVFGSPTHSSRPELGVNAVEAMADVLRAARDIELPTHPQLGRAILVPTDIASRPYPALSVVPDHCIVTFDRRTLPGEREEDVVEQLRAVVEAAVAPHGATRPRDAGGRSLRLLHGRGRRGAELRGRVVHRSGGAACVDRAGGGRGRAALLDVLHQRQRHRRRWAFRRSATGRETRRSPTASTSSSSSTSCTRAPRATRHSPRA